MNFVVFMEIKKLRHRAKFFEWCQKALKIIFNLLHKNYIKKNIFLKNKNFWRTFLILLFFYDMLGFICNFLELSRVRKHWIEFKIINFHLNLYPTLSSFLLLFCKHYNNKFIFKLSKSFFAKIMIDVLQERDKHC